MTVSEYEFFGVSPMPQPQPTEKHFDELTREEQIARTEAWYQSVDWKARSEQQSRDREKFLASRVERLLERLCEVGGQLECDAAMEIERLSEELKMANEDDA